MTRTQFRQKINGTLPTKYREDGTLVPSETDPSFAMTGQQMFIAAMTGQGLPFNGVTYEYNNIEDPTKISSIDSIKADVFDIKREYAHTTDAIKDDYFKWKIDNEQEKNE